MIELSISAAHRPYMVVEVLRGGGIIAVVRANAPGAMGDDEALVCALEMAPSQIRIGSHVARSPERGRRPKFAEIASVQKDGIVVERWNKKRFDR